MQAITKQLSSLEAPTLKTNYGDRSITCIVATDCFWVHTHLSLDELKLSLCQLDNQTSNATAWLAADFKASRKQ